MSAERPIMRRIMDMIKIRDDSYDQFWQDIMDYDYAKMDLTESQIDHDLESHLHPRFRHFDSDMGLGTPPPGIYPGERNDGLGEPK